VSTRKNNPDKSAENACALPDLRAILSAAEVMREDTRAFKVLGDFMLVRRDNTMLDLYSIAYVQTIDLERE
jgi:hypothetical protein